MNDIDEREQIVKDALGRWLDGKAPGEDQTAYYADVMIALSELAEMARETRQLAGFLEDQRERFGVEVQATP